MSDQTLIEAMARDIAVADAKEGCLEILLGSESYMEKAQELATAALAALRETHHLVPKDQEPHLARVERIAREVEWFFKEAMPGVDIGRIACLAADMMAKELIGQTIAADRPLEKRHDD